MANLDQFIANCLNDVEVKLKQHIQQNFRTGSFYGEGWPAKRMYPGAKQKQLYKNGMLQESVDPQANHAEQTITVHSSLPYAAIHNEGGEITVTAKMKRFFWAMHLKAAGAVSRTVARPDGSRHTFVSTGSRAAMAKQRGSTTKKAGRLNAEAEYWKGLALMKVGSKLKIPKRQFVGDHPMLNAAIEKIVTDNVREIEAALAAQLQATIK